MTVDLHSAVRTAVDEARRQAEAAIGHSWHASGVDDYETTVKTEDGRTLVEVLLDDSDTRDHHPRATETARFIAAWSPSRALAMCDWADDVLARHLPAEYPDATFHVCNWCKAPDGAFSEIEWPCAEVRILAAAFGVETGETP